MRIALTVLATLAMVIGAGAAAEAKGPNARNGAVLTVDTSQAGSLPASRAVSGWNQGLTTFSLVTGDCSGTGCVHVVQVFAHTTWCSSGAVGCTYGNADGSCTVEVVLSLRFAQFKNVNLAVLDTTEHELGHALGGASTPAVAAESCRGLPHDTACDSIMQPMLGYCGTLPRGPSVEDYAAANALYA